MKITNRDIKIFILGLVTFFLVESIYNWESSINEFKRGWNDGSTSDSKIIIDKEK